MEQNYAYPLDPSWSVAEIETVMAFLNTVEAAYEGGVAAAKVQATYQAFKRVVPAKSEEKRLGRDFARASGYQLYEVVQAALANPQGRVALTVRG